MSDIKETLRMFGGMKGTVYRDALDEIVRLERNLAEALEMLKRIKKAEYDYYANFTDEVDSLIAELEKP